MSINNATDYADSLLKSIEDACESGYPFGVSNEYTGEHFDTMDEARENTDECDWDNLAEASGYDYLSDVLDIEYIVSADRTYKAARVLIAFGGPNAWINTQTGSLEVAWWSEPVYRSLPSEFINGLDDALEELYEMG